MGHVALGPRSIHQGRVSEKFGATENKVTACSRRVGAPETLGLLCIEGELVLILVLVAQARAWGRTLAPEGVMLTRQPERP